MKTFYGYVILSVLFAIEIGLAFLTLTPWTIASAVFVGAMWLHGLVILISEAASLISPVSISLTSGQLAAQNEVNQRLAELMGHLGKKNQND